MEQSDSKFLFMTDEQIAEHKRKQIDLRNQLLAAIPEQKSDKDQIEHLEAELAAEQEKVKVLEATWIGYNKLQEQLAAAQATIAEAADEIESWGSYASEYFQKKHDLAGTVARFRSANQDALNQIKAGYEATIADVRSNLLAASCYIDCLGGNSTAYRIAHAIPVNQDALNEMLARECERLMEMAQAKAAAGYGDLDEHDLREQAAAHRARKEVK